LRRDAGATGMHDRYGANASREAEWMRLIANQRQMVAQIAIRIQLLLQNWHIDYFQ